jgi:ankyrin repeat protein
MAGERAASEDLEVSRVFLNHGANVNARNQEYRTPIHLSTDLGYLETVKLLLERRGADIHAINSVVTARVKHQYRSESARADSEKGATRFFI